MPIGAKMDNKEIILKYLKDKSNEGAVIAVLQEQKKMIANKPGLLDNEDFSLMLKLAKNSKGKIEYHALIILSNIELCFDAKNFYELCQVAAENSTDNDGNIRRACFLLIKNLNAMMMVLPIISKLKNSSKSEINLFYESYHHLFYKLYYLYYNGKHQNIKISALHSLEIMLPKFQDMAGFWNDEEEIGMANKIKGEISKGLYNGTRN